MTQLDELERLAMAEKRISIGGPTLLRLIKVVRAAKAVTEWLIVDEHSRPLIDTVKELDDGH